MHEPIVAGDFKDGSDEWLACRRNGIGASDTPSILGIEGAFSNVQRVWADKVGAIEDSDDGKMEEIFRIAHALEPVIANEFSNESGFEILQESRTLAHPENQFIMANLDFWTNVHGKWGPLEIKNVMSWSAKQWEDSVPPKYDAQVQHQMYVTGAEIGAIAALIGGCEIKWKVIDRDEAFIEAMVEKLSNFWEMVQKNEMPMDGELDLDVIKKLHVSEGEDPIVLPFEVLHWTKQIDLAKENIKEWEQFKKDAEAKVWAALSGASSGITPDGSVRYKVVTNAKGTKYLRVSKEE